MAGARMRQLRGMEIVSKGGQVRRIAELEYLVHSQHTRSWYSVQRKGGRWLCECPDYLKRKQTCKHGYAIAFMLDLPRILSINLHPSDLNCPCAQMPHTGLLEKELEQ
jgi:hypothetical protein